MLKRHLSRSAFQIIAAATTKARLPMVERKKDGTTNWLVGLQWHSIDTKLHISSTYGDHNCKMNLQNWLVKLNFVQTSVLSASSFISLNKRDTFPVAKYEYKIQASQLSTTYRNTSTESQWSTLMISCATSSPIQSAGGLRIAAIEVDRCWNAHPTTDSPRSTQIRLLL